MSEEEKKRRKRRGRGKGRRTRPKQKRTQGACPVLPELIGGSVMVVTRPGKAALQREIRRGTVRRGSPRVIGR